MEKEYEILQLGESKYKTIIPDNVKNRKLYETPDPKMVFSYIPGLLPEIFVKEGQKVEVGEQLLILEAMKMRNKIRAHISGVIKKIHVKENQNVPKNHLLIEFE